VSKIQCTKSVHSTSNSVLTAVERTEFVRWALDSALG
jgi:hypothetical protein